ASARHRRRRLHRERGVQAPPRSGPPGDRRRRHVEGARLGGTRRCRVPRRRRPGPGGARRGGGGGLRRGPPLRRPLPRRRVGHRARPLLQDQRRRIAQPARCHASRWLQASGVLVDGCGLWRARGHSDPRVSAHPPDQSLRRLQDRRRHGHRVRGRRVRAGSGEPQVLQRRRRLRSPRRAPRPGNPSHPFRAEGGAGRRGRRPHLRHRLPDARRNGDPRLHPRRRPGSGAPPGPRGHCRAGPPHLQPRQRHGLLRARGGGHGPPGHGVPDPRGRVTAPARRPPRPRRLERPYTRRTGLGAAEACARGHGVRRLAVDARPRPGRRAPGL
ncbi:MAG: UDP-glucose 4-epimerase, partial [uncultured Acidimicrobiales bacterium]